MGQAVAVYQRQYGSSANRRGRHGGSPSFNGGTAQPDVAPVCRARGRDRQVWPHGAALAPWAGNSSLWGGRRPAALVLYVLGVECALMSA